VFVKVIPQIGKVHGGWEGLKTLAFSIAHARLVDDRRRRLRNTRMRRYDQFDDERSHPSVEDEALAGLGHQELVDLFAFLPHDQRSVTTLRGLADLSMRRGRRIRRRWP